MPIKTTKHVVQLRRTGWFVKDWQYSQGNLDYSETDNVLEARDIAPDHYKRFFLEIGTLLAVDIKWTVKEVPRSEWDKAQPFPPVDSFGNHGPSRPLI